MPPITTTAQQANTARDAVAFDVIRFSPATSSALLGVLATVISFVKAGFGLHPEWHRLQDAAAHWPTVMDSPLIMEGDRSLLSNMTTSMLSGLLGARTPMGYLAVSAALTAIAIALPLLMPAIRSSRTATRLAFVMIVGGATPAVLLSWIGGYDAIIVVAITIAALARTKWVSWAGWFVVAFSHAPVAFIALLLWLPMMALARRREDTTSTLVRGTGASVAVLVGWVTIRTLTDVWGGSTDRLSLWQAIDVGDIASAYLSSLPLLVFSILGIGWAVALHPAVRHTQLGRLLLAEAVVVLLVIPWIAVDETRISVLVLFGTVLAFAAGMANEIHEDAGRRIWRVLVVPAALIPVPVIWMGVPIVHPWPGVSEVLAAARS